MTDSKKDENVDHSFAGRLEARKAAQTESERKARIQERVEKAARFTGIEAGKGSYHPDLFIPHLKEALFESEKTAIGYAYTRFEEREPVQTNQEIEVIFPSTYPTKVINELKKHAKAATTFSDDYKNKPQKDFFIYESELPEWHPKHAEGGSRMVFKHHFFKPEFVGASFITDAEVQKERMSAAGVSVLAPPGGGNNSRG